MNEDKFLERLRADARELRYDIDDVGASRLRARVRSRLEHTGVAQLIAAWCRPLAASLSALALIATIGLAVVERDQTASLFNDSVEVSLGGVTYSVAE